MTAKSHPYTGLEQPDTNNATWFNPNQKSASDYWKDDEYWQSTSAFRYQQKSKMWKYLGELNDGFRNGKRTNKTLFTYLDNCDLIENVALQLDLPKVYWPTARQYYFVLHDKNVEGISKDKKLDGVRKDSTAVAVVEYIIHTQQEKRSFHPNTKMDGGRTVAEYLAERFSLPVKTIHKRYGEVKTRIEKADLTAEPEGFDRRNMSRRGLSGDGRGGYSGINSDLLR